VKCAREALCYGNINAGNSKQIDHDGEGKLLSKSEIAIRLD